MMKIAYFITPHGFGHAARSCAIMEAVKTANPEASFKLLTTVPKWFFEHTLNSFEYIPVKADLGLVQNGPMNEDLTATVEALEKLYPYSEHAVQEAADQTADCDVILCDIAPLGIAAGNTNGVPTVLIENFTWDWIYQGYSDCPQLSPFINYLQTLYSKADYHLQLVPVCSEKQCSKRIAPIRRKPRVSSKTIRSQLGIDDSKLVLISMGGVEGAFPFLDQLKTFKHTVFLIPGSVETARREDNLLLYPQNSGFHHPDLVEACDVIIGKAGYSTLAETWHAGVPMGALLRESFPETPALAEFIKAEIPGTTLSPEDWENGKWLNHLPQLLETPRITRTVRNGAEDVADFLCEIVTR